MSSERFTATRLIVIPAAIGICFCAFLPALAAGEDVEPGQRRLRSRQVRRRGCQKPARWRIRARRIRSGSRWI